MVLDLQGANDELQEEWLDKRGGSLTWSSAASGSAEALLALRRALADCFFRGGQLRIAVIS